MKESFNDDINSLTGMRSSNSAPTTIDEKAPTDAFEKSWDLSLIHISEPTRRS